MLRTVPCLALALSACTNDPCATDPSLPLQARIDAACEGGEISIPAGTFPGNLEIRKPLTLAGAGQDRTILEGTGEDSVVLVAPEATAVRLEGLTITGGTTGSCEDEDECRARAGGGLMVLGSVTLADVRVTGNQARDAGGGIWVGYDFEADASGRLYTEHDVLVDENAAPQGAGIEVATARAELVGTTVRSNTSTDDAALIVWNAGVDLGADTHIVDNDGGCCGAILGYNFRLTVDGAEIARNTGSEAAGAYLMYDRYGESYLTSTHGDWGTTEDVDIAFEVGGSYTFGDDASFRCISIGCL